MCRRCESLFFVRREGSVPDATVAGLNKGGDRVKVRRIRVEVVGESRAEERKGCERPGAGVAETKMRMALCFYLGSFVLLLTDRRDLPRPAATCCDLSGDLDSCN